MWEPITNEQKTNMVSEMIKIKSEIQDKANDIKIEEKAKQKKFNFHERVRYEQIYQQKVDLKEKNKYDRTANLKDGLKS